MIQQRLKSGQRNTLMGQIFKDAALDMYYLMVAHRITSK